MADKTDTPKIVLADRKWAQWYLKHANLVLDMAPKFKDAAQEDKAQEYAAELLKRAIKRTTYRPQSDPPQ